MFMAMLASNIFLKIIDGTIPAQILHRDEYCLAFHDIQPQAPVHVLIIPIREIRTHDDLLKQEDAAVVGHMHIVAARLAKELGLADGYRLVINCKDAGGQTVPHLHMHLLGGRNLGWPPG
jgi:histidine triad (HIT) family protein